MLDRRSLSLLLAALAVPTGGGRAFAQAAWPSRTVKVIVPGAGGSATDIVARAFTEEFSKAFGQTFVVDNKPGANGILGTVAAAQAPPDGYNLLVTYAAAQLVNPLIYEAVNYDALKDFTPVAQISAGGNFLIVPPGNPATNLEEFIAYVKSKPAGQLTYGSWGIGSGGHIAMEALNRAAGLNIRHVPYKSSPAAINDVLGSQIDAAFAPILSTIPLHKAGKLKAVAFAGPKRSPFLPDVKTMTEQGVPFELAPWFGLFAPAGTPPDIVAKLNGEVNRLLDAPERAQQWETLGFSGDRVRTPQEFDATVRRDYKQWADLVSAIGIKIKG